jgi:hypothetical protein
VGSLPGPAVLNAALCRRNDQTPAFLRCHSCQTAAEKLIRARFADGYWNPGASTGESRGQEPDLDPAQQLSPPRFSSTPRIRHQREGHLAKAAELMARACQKNESRFLVVASS